MRTPALLLSVVLSAGSLLACGGSPAAPVPAQIQLAAGAITFTPNPGFVPAPDKRIELHLREVDGSPSSTTPSMVAIGRLCHGGTAGCGAGGVFSFPSPLSVRTNVDYALVVADADRSFVSYTTSPGQFTVNGRTVTRTRLLPDSPTSDSVRLAGIFRVVDGKGTIE